MGPPEISCFNGHDMQGTPCALCRNRRCVCTALRVCVCVCAFSGTVWCSGTVVVKYAAMGSAQGVEAQGVEVQSTSSDMQKVYSLFAAMPRLLIRRRTAFMAKEVAMNA
eukprot:61056-Pelagomonas_calceolata.AAC.1